jgi:hypothetical protein
MSDKFMAKMYKEGCIDAVKERQATYTASRTFVV